MGLDNIPTTYPCHKQGTAIERTVVDPDGTSYQHVSCDATIAAHRCPWAVAQEGRGTAVYGMLGTPCWYRGKTGTYMLETLAEAGYVCADAEGGFYGPDGDVLTPEHCRNLGGWMANHVEAYAAAVAKQDDYTPTDIAMLVDEYRYAAWWLTWIADAGDGAQAWW